MQQSNDLQPLLQWAQAIVPIPLSAPRMRERGYNPAAQLCQQLAHRHLPAHLHALVRQQHTPSQRGLNRAQRLRNLQGAFAMHSNHRLAGQRVLLVDDVMTTGATLTSAAACLLSAGAASVQVLCVARTP